jgi:tripartite-type tricarboxylate transporter receptor subunit TctC
MQHDQAPRRTTAAARHDQVQALARRPFNAMLAAGLMALCAAATTAHAQEVYPSKPVTMLVAFPPGGPADVIARAMQRSMANVLKQPVIIENLPGAGGALAVQRLLSRPADGYTLIMGSPNEAILAPLSNASAKYKPEELELIAPISSNPLVVMARNGLPYASLAEVIAAGKKPGSQSVTFGSPGHGSMYHIVSEYLAQTTGAKLLHVPYKGATPMMQDLAGEQIDITILPNLGASTQLLENHKIKALNILDGKRMRTLPDVPAISETTVAHKEELVHSVWLGVMTRAGTPPDRARLLLAASQQGIQSPEIAKALEPSGSTPLAAQSLPVSAKFYGDEIDKFKKMALSIKLTPQ